MTGIKVKVRDDLKPYFSFVEIEEKPRLKCLQIGCEKKFRTFDQRQGWNSHISHLFTAHKILLKKPSSNSSPSISNFVKKSVKSDYDFKNHKDCYAKTALRQMQFEENLLDLVAAAGLPLNLVDHPMFIRFVRHLDSRVRICSRRTVGRNLQKEAAKIFKIYKAALARVRESCLHSSFDLWSTRSHISVLGIKVHFISDAWKLQNHTVGFLEFTGKKDSINVRKSFTDYMQECGIKPEQIGVVMTDNAAENVKAFAMHALLTHEVSRVSEQEDLDSEEEDEAVEKEAEQENIDWANSNTDVDGESRTTEAALNNEVVERLEDHEDEIVERLEVWSKKCIKRHGCVNHALQLVIKEALALNPSTKQIMKTVDALLALFNSSNYYNRRLITLAGKGIIKIGATRWNGFLLALDRMLEPGYFAHINKVLEEVHEERRKIKRKNKNPDKLPLLISLQEQKEMVELSTLLHPFLDLTMILQGDGVTSSSVIPGIINLHNRVFEVQCNFEYMDALRRSLCITIAERFGASKQYRIQRGAPKQLLKIFESKEHILATILDPRLKLTTFSNAMPRRHVLAQYIPSEATAKQVLIDAFEEKETNAEISITADDDRIDCTPKPAKVSKTQNLVFAHISDENEDAVVDPPKNEVEDYLLEAKMASNSCPLAYWEKKSKDGEYPILCMLAQIYLGFPGTSSGIERTFSISGSYARAKRARLTVPMIRNLLFYRDARVAQSVSLDVHK